MHLFFAICYEIFRMNHLTTCSKCVIKFAFIRKRIKCHIKAVYEEAASPRTSPEVMASLCCR